MDEATEQRKPTSWIARFGWAIAIIVAYAPYFAGITFISNWLFPDNLKVLIGLQIAGPILAAIAFVPFFVQENHEPGTLSVGIFTITVIGAIVIYSYLYDYIAYYVIGFIVFNNLTIVAYFVVFFITVLMALGAYRLRCKNRRIYGVLELSFGLVSVFYSAKGYIDYTITNHIIQNATTKFDSNLYIVIIQFIAGVYIIVRGLSNIEDSFKSTPPIETFPASWVKLFYR